MAVARQVFRFDPPERFIAGTVGQPGQRAFFLQAREGSRLATVLLEKEQVAALAERLDALLDEVIRQTGGAAPVPALPPAELEDAEPLEQPIQEDFRVGTLTLAWDGTDDRVVIEAFAEGADPPDDAAAGEEPASEDVEELTEGRDVLVVRITGATARAFVKRAQALVAAGRPPCPLCALPLDPEGHVCPRQNGHMRQG